MNRESQNIPEEMKGYPHWLVWKLIDKGGEKPSKVPFSVHGGAAAVNDSATWGTFKEAAAAYEASQYDGIGFVFTGTPFVGIDIDSCINQETGEVSPEAADIIKATQSYTELSQSGKGLHIIMRGKLPAGRRRNGPFEMYGDGSPRYFAMTGNLWGEPTGLEANQAAIDAVHKKYIAKQEKPAEAETMEDKQLILSAATARNGGVFSALYNGDWQGKYKSQSEADMAFCDMLAFWTGCNAEQMDRIFRKSGLMRPKWDEQHGSRTYGEKTIQKARDDCKEVYSSNYKEKDINLSEFPAAIRADELQKKVFPDICWLWDCMLTTGLVLFVGASKIGKSWFAMQLALSVAAGADFLGRRTKKSKVLYLALEDSQRRLQNRMNKLLGTAKASGKLELLTEAPILGKGLIEYLTPFVMGGTKLIIIDTLQKIRGANSGNKNAYAADYEDISTLKKFADRNDIAILVVHHTRKMKDDDVFNMISGTNGIMGAADTIMVLMKEKRKDTRAYLDITGRDVMSDTLVIEKDTKVGYGWAYVGKKDAIEEMTEAQKYDTDPVVLTIRELVKDTGAWSGTATNLKNEIEAHRGVEINVNFLGRKLRELQSDLFTKDNIVYSTPTGDNTKKIHTFKVDGPLCI